jgi:type IV secretory pathway protease TraF
VYPNPSSGSITVDFGEGKVGSLTIYNAQGQQLQQASIKSGVRYEASQSLPTGLYFIEVFTDGDKRTSKLIIAK